MAVTPVTPIPGVNTSIGLGATPVLVFPANPLGINGGIITNPANATESLFVDPTGAAPNLTAGGTTFEIPPGGTWRAIAGQITSTNVVAATTGHSFTAVYY